MHFFEESRAGRSPWLFIESEVRNIKFRLFNELCCFGKDFNVFRHSHSSMKSRLAQDVRFLRPVLRESGRDRRDQDSSLRGHAHVAGNGSGCCIAPPATTTTEHILAFPCCVIFRRAEPSISGQFKTIGHALNIDLA